MNAYRILVVDDEEDLCEILQFNLETDGYHVDVAYSAEEALKKDLSVYNLLLLDVMMGEISGFRMARTLRENPKTALIPIIFLTAKDSENDRLTGFNIGADDYISKPFSIREVIARVKAVIRRVDNKKTDAAPILKLSYEKLEMDILEEIVQQNYVKIIEDVNQVLEPIARKKAEKDKLKKPNDSRNNKNMKL